LICLSFSITNLNDCYAQKDGEKIIIGKYKKIQSKILNEERTLLIHLPKGYKNSTISYPVLYLLYGNHVTTYFAEAVAILDRLGQTARIPEMILVGLKNTDRYRDLLPKRPDGGATGIDNFIYFFEGELIPFVETYYRTKDYRIIMGPQAGANFVFYTLFENPDLFDACLINNPFRWTGGRDLLVQKSETFFQNNKQFNRFLFITYDDSDQLEIEGIKYIQHFSEMIKSANPEGFQFELNYIKGSDEFVSPMGLRKGLKTLFLDYPLPENLEIEKLDDIINYYQKLSKKLGFEVDIPEHVLTVQSDKVIRKGYMNSYLEILNYMIKKYPFSSNAYWRLGNLHQRSGELTEAIKYYNKILEYLKDDVGMIKARIQMLERRKNESAVHVIRQTLDKSGLASALKKYNEIKADNQKILYLDEREFNELGYYLMGAGKMNEAIEIFKLNVKEYPESANVFDSLGEAYMNNDEKELAIRNYEKSLELNPNNNNAKEMLKKLEE